ncbi:Clt3 protein [Thalictrum thalictroides]|uniref:Clt3 protein n=1 Tax=Thalictrum thalictroides TaxID=46969 RepID=A0A7J6VGN0_THATH|nr:Clt3 protein [Thalictrum thalictroides]
MLSLPKAPFIAVGLLEALAAASGMAAGAILSGASIPILSQTFLVWQLLLSAIFLGRRYSFNQVVGCLLVAIGVIITVASGSNGGLSMKEASVFWTLLMITSFFLQAADTVLKEIIFLDTAQRLKGGCVDLFVVNSYGSAFQAFFICLLLPFLSKLWGVPFGQLPSYLKDGAVCFLNIGSLSNGCQGAPLLPLLFIIVNMAFNVSLLHLLKISSAVVSCLASTFSVPLSVYAFTLPLPYIGVASSLPAGFVSGVVVLVAGLLVYAWTPSANSTTTLDPQTTPAFSAVNKADLPYPDFSAVNLPYPDFSAVNNITLPLKLAQITGTYFSKEMFMETRKGPAAAIKAFGRFLWLQDDGKEVRIISFNLANEKFGIIKDPNMIGKDFRYSLFKFEGSLCWVQQPKCRLESIDIWMLKNARNSVWTMMTKTITLPLERYKSPASQLLRLLASWQLQVVKCWWLHLILMNGTYLCTVF